MGWLTYLSVHADSGSFGAINGRRFHVYVNGVKGLKCKQVLTLFGIGFAWFDVGDRDAPNGGYREKLRITFGRIRLEKFK